MTAVERPPFVPAGTDSVARWALGRRVGFEPRPDPTWFRAWEPFDTMVAPAHYYGACSWPAPPGSITLVEPYTESEDSQLDPLDRTVLAFASHPALRHRCAARVGEHFITRVSFLSDKPPPRVHIGDPVWDEHVVTMAPSAEIAQAALTPALRRLLQGWGFAGHLELRPGCAIVHIAGVQPTPGGYEHLGRAAPQIVLAALTP
jgi:hypothetical protein